jgi:arylsulfatase A
MILTHSPFQPTPDSTDWDPTIKSEREQQDNRHFADMTAYTDRMVGRVVARLDELKLRDNTLLIFLGDNGTLGSISSRFQGHDFRGGKGRTNHRGTHVPCIVNWPAVIKQGSVCSDLISSTDILPTICNAAGIAVPSDVDGVSFLPQLKGEPGNPRSWLYTWYSPRQRLDLTVKEYAFNHNFKLYRTGEFYDLSSDPEESHPIPLNSLEGATKAAATNLQAVLENFDSARPAELDEQFKMSAKSDSGSASKNTKKKRTDKKKVR